jgi:hypothetical protein
MARKKPRIERPIARRVLRHASGARSVEVVIRAPLQDTTDPNGDWECQFEVTGLDPPIRDRAMGVDSLQALLEAIRAIRHLLRPVQAELSWLSGVPGDTGIPLIPSCDHPEFVAIVEHTIEAEAARRALYMRPPGKTRQRRKR